MAKYKKPQRGNIVRHKRQDLYGKINWVKRGKLQVEVRQGTRFTRHTWKIASCEMVG